ncbi:MAG: CapA family protein [Muribaculaceae bacterium]|nr:CapA family protein [Muribaculaceae bacterium]
MRFSNVLLVVIAALMPFMGCGMPKVKTKSRAKKARTTVLAKPKATTKVTPQAQPKEARPQFTGEVTIAMTGDIMTGSILPTPNMPPNDGRDTFIDCAKLLQSADVACGNLEGVLGDSGKPRKAPGPLSFSFMMPTKSVQLLVDAGYDFLGIANNHINDFYPVAIQSTIKTLRDNGIGVAGTRDCETCIREINGVKYGFCAFGHESYTLRTQDKATVTRIVKKLRSECDIVIVCFHGGSEGVSERHLPYGTEYFHGADRGNLREFAHLCIDSGADIVYGHGPHVCRAMELYKGHLIAYSLGNFATPRGMKLDGPTSYAPLLIVKLQGGKFAEGQIHPFIQYRDKGPRVDKSGAVIKEIQSLSNEDIKDNELVIADDGKLLTKQNSKKE